MEDISREGLTGAKVRQLGRLFRPSQNYAIAKVRRFSEINIQRINELLMTNFKGVILDVDECIAPHHGEIIQENIDAIIDMVNQGIRIVIFSNMRVSERYDSFIQTVKEETGYEIKVIMSRYAKPDSRGFDECVQALELHEGEEALMVGDNFITDGGSIGAGIPFVKVKPIKTKEGIFKKIKRSPQIGSRGFYSFVSNVYDKAGRRRVLRDIDFLEKKAELNCAASKE
jgi:uncharacterized protein